MKQQLKGEALLFLAALIWGVSFVFQKTGMDYIGPMTFGLMRFSIGAIVTLPFVYLYGWYCQCKGIPLPGFTDRTMLTAGVLTGLTNFGLSSLQQIGLVYTTAGKAGFTMMSMALRKPKSGLPKKMEEMASIGDSAQSPIVPLYAAAPEKIWNSIEECDEFLKNMTIPVGYFFANDDPVFQDYYESNIYGIMNTRGARTIILNGEKHLMELDSPERVASEVFGFIDECHKGFYKEIMEPDLYE